MAHHPQDTSIMLAATSDSLFHSSDGGYSWLFISHFNGLPVNCLLYDPDYDDTVYALLGDGTYSDGIYRSTDGGNNWNVLEWLFRPRAMTITRPGRIMLVGCYGPGVFKSEDEGNNWILWNDALVDSHVHAVDYCWAPGSTLVGLAGTSQGMFHRLYTTPWVQAGGIPVNLRVSSIDHSKSMQLGFASVTGGSWSDGVYRTTDNGYTWQVVDWWIYSSAVAMNPLWQDYPNDTCGIFAGDSGLGVKYSDDCGTTWQEVNSGLGNLYINMLSYHPQDSMRLFAATQDGLYRYEYSPGVAENRVDDPCVSAFRLSSVHRAGRPIALISSMAGNNGLSPLRVTIYDASGRFERAEILGPRSSALAPIHESGVYFLIVDAHGALQREKIIVID
jgi:photosystem II stability/assembly factor-like uncharacterized protein